MQNAFEVIPLTEAELKEVAQHQLLLTVKPLYAPAIMRSFFRGHPNRPYTAEQLAETTKLELKQVRVIAQRMCRDQFLLRRISPFARKTLYTFVPAYDYSNYI